MMLCAQSLCKYLSKARQAKRREESRGELVKEYEMIYNLVYIGIEIEYAYFVRAVNYLTIQSTSS